ncbi:MAG TPA: polyprenyl synthetase family protein, partial [Abditibacteriaceae bacterium]|nr:polyprenyl synthetase family protein [Abditibacteriaceae bacterium]
MSEIRWSFAPDLVESALHRVLETADSRLDEGRNALREAMRYAVLGGGKRLRAGLVVECAHVVGGALYKVENALPAACAMEMIHAYSLVHDDLPAMDNADTRRGRPSCHKQFGEATAILAGDALLTQAFETLSNGDWPAASIRQVVALLAKASGESGMVGGQATDVSWSHAHQESVGGDELLQMHALKTGALLRASAEIGAVVGGGNDAQIESLRNYGAHLGRAFQIADDLLDATGDPNQTGKASSDSANGKI